jgi:Ca2+-binding EF-hand superfamily protein/CRP-like cAMP-binding protein
MDSFEPSTRFAAELAIMQKDKSRRTDENLRVLLAMVVAMEIDFVLHLPYKQQKSLVRCLQCGTYSAGEWLFRAGDQSGHVYIVLSGSVSIWGKVDATADKEVHLADIAAGHTFGEIGRVRSASAHIDRETILIWLTASDFVDTLHLKRAHEEAIAANIRQLQSVPLFDICSFVELENFAHLIDQQGHEARTFSKGSTIRKQGDESRELLVIVSGTVELSGRLTLESGDGAGQLDIQLGAVGCGMLIGAEGVIRHGDQSLASEWSYTATCHVEALVFPAHRFRLRCTDEMLSSVEEFMKATVHNSEVSKEAAQQLKWRVFKQREFESVARPIKQGPPAAPAVISTRCRKVDVARLANKHKTSAQRIALAEDSTEYGGGETDELKLKQIWAAVDADGTGTLDEDELRRVFIDMGRPISDKKLTAVFKKIDKDGSGELEFEEFLEWWRFQNAEAENAKQWIQFDTMATRLHACIAKREVVAARKANTTGLLGPKGPRWSRAMAGMDGGTVERELSTALNDENWDPAVQLTSKQTSKVGSQPRAASNHSDNDATGNENSDGRNRAMASTLTAVATQEEAVKILDIHEGIKVCSCLYTVPMPQLVVLRAKVSDESSDPTKNSPLAWLEQLESVFSNFVGMANLASSDDSKDSLSRVREHGTDDVIFIIQLRANATRDETIFAVNKMARLGLMMHSRLNILNHRAKNASLPGQSKYTSDAKKIFTGMVGLRIGLAIGSASASVFGVRRPVYFAVTGAALDEAALLATEADLGGILMSEHARKVLGPRVLAVGMSVEELKLKQIWAAIDADGTGTLDEDELRHVFNDMRRPISDKKLTAVFKQIDKDGSGELEFEEFLEWWRSQSTQVPKSDPPVAVARQSSRLAGAIARPAIGSHPVSNTPWRNSATWRLVAKLPTPPTEVRPVSARQQPGPRPPNGQPPWPAGPSAMLSEAAGGANRPRSAAARSTAPRHCPPRPGAVRCPQRYP